MSIADTPFWRPYLCDLQADAAIIVLDDGILDGGAKHSIWCNAIDEWITIDLDTDGKIGMIQFLSASRLVEASSAVFQALFSMEYQAQSNRLMITLFPGLTITKSAACDTRLESLRILFSGDILAGFEIIQATNVVQRSILDMAVRNAR